MLCPFSLPCLTQKTPYQEELVRNGPFIDKRIGRLDISSQEIEAVALTNDDTCLGCSTQDF